MGCVRRFFFFIKNDIRSLGDIQGCGTISQKQRTSSRSIDHPLSADNEEPGLGLVYRSSGILCILYSTFDRAFVVHL
ncbi:hypothetical protein LSH36_100g03030, partial [Paralvinella palmiformis]